MVLWLVEWLVATRGVREVGLQGSGLERAFARPCAGRKVRLARGVG